MKSLFREDSLIRQALASLADDLLYSILTLICSIPLVTAGAAVTALFDLIMRTETGLGCGVSVYFQRFRFHFRKATLSWACLIILDTLLFFGLRLNASAEGAFRGMLWGLLFFVGWMLLFLHMYLPPLLTAERNLTPSALWKSALFTGIALLPRSILMLFIAAFPLLCYIFLTNVFWSISFFWVFFWPAITVRIFFSLIQKYFSEFNKPEDTDGDTLRK